MPSFAPARASRLAGRRRGRAGNAAHATTTLLAALVALAAVYAAGCSSTKPPATSTLSGTVNLVGTLRDTTGAPLGSRTETTADDVRLHLEKSGVVLDTTTTVHGAFVFPGLTSGTYRVVAPIVGTLAASTRTLTIPGDDVKPLEPLVVGPFSGLDTYPNPVTTGASIRFSLAADGRVTLQGTDLAGTHVALIVDAMLSAGAQTASWDGLDDADNALPTGPYWVVFAQGDDFRADLIFKE